MVDHARKKFEPPERMTVSEWADRNRILSKEESSYPGPWRTDRVPYLKKIMDAFNDESITTIIFLKPTQVGATETGINIIGYTIDQDPSRLLYVMPDDDIAKSFSADRLQGALSRCKALEGKYFADKSKNNMLRFRGGFIMLASANSPAKLASWSVPKVFMDEIDKYPVWSGKEASPLKLAEERTKNWPNKKIFLASTPTLETGQIYKAYQSADVHYKFYIQCPKCGQWQKLEFGNLIIPHKKGEKMDASVVASTAYYQCCNPECEHHITDAEKIQQLKGGRWLVEGDKPEGKPKKVGFSLNALYSPWVTFGRVAEEFVRSKDDPEDLQNFVNSWLGEPWKPKTEKASTSAVLKQRTKLPIGIVPKWTKLLTAGVDVQKGYFYWAVRAWGAEMTSQNVAYGRAITWGDLQQVMDTWFPIEGSRKKMQIVLYCIDEGYRKEEVYDYCFENYPNCMPVKGSSRQLDKYYVLSPLVSSGQYAMSIKRCVADTDKYKDLIFSRMNRPVGTLGSWMVSADTEQEYADQMTSEHRIITEKNGIQVATWKPIANSHVMNHWLDCEVYATVAADIMNVRIIRADDEDMEEFSGAGTVDPDAIIPKVGDLIHGRNLDD